MYSGIAQSSLESLLLLTFVVALKGAGLWLNVALDATGLRPTCGEVAGGLRAVGGEVAAAFRITGGDLVLLVREPLFPSLPSLFGPADVMVLIAGGVGSYAAVLHLSSFAIKASCSCYVESKINRYRCHCAYECVPGCINQMQPATFKAFLHDVISIINTSLCDFNYRHIGFNALFQPVASEDSFRLGCTFRVQLRA